MRSRAGSAREDLSEKKSTDELQMRSFSRHRGPAGYDLLAFGAVSRALATSSGLGT